MGWYFFLLRCYSLNKTFSWKKKWRAERILTEYLNCPLALQVSDQLPSRLPSPIDFTPSCNWFFKMTVGHNFLGKIIYIWNSSWNQSFQLNLIKFKIMKWFSKTHHILHRTIGKDKWECEHDHRSASLSLSCSLTSAIPSIKTARYQFRPCEGGQFGGFHVSFLP